MRTWAYLEALWNPPEPAFRVLLGFQGQVPLVHLRFRHTSRRWQTVAVSRLRMAWERGCLRLLQRPWRRLRCRQHQVVLSQEAPQWQTRSERRPSVQWMHCLQDERLNYGVPGPLL